MIMNKKILCGIAAIVFAGMSVINVKFITKTRGFSILQLANIEALADGESTQIIHGYYLKYVNGGVITETCTISGQISVLGVTISGNYTKGGTYSFGWEAYACEPANSQSIQCDVGDQGIYVNGTKVGS